MPVDVRAKVFCNLGPLISGNISDEPVSAGQGLIRCRGQIVIKGLITPTIGTMVTLGYQRNNRVARIPRVLRVLGSFADPFRNTTTVSLGDKLVLLAEKRSNLDLFKTKAPEVAELNEQFNFTDNQVEIPRKWNGACWQQITQAEEERDQLIQDHPLTQGFMFDTVAASQKVTAAEQYSKSPLKNFLTIKPSLSASFIAAKCLSALGLGGGTSLTNDYNASEFDLSEGYVSVLEKLLAAESKIGYLNEAEVFVTRDIDGAAPSGVLITENDIVDVSPLSIGTPPADELRVFSSSKENIVTEQPLPNVAPVANPFRLDNVGHVNNETFEIRAATFIKNGFDPDYLVQSAVGAATKLRVESVTAGQGCEVQLVSASIQKGVQVVAVIPNPGYSGIGSVTYTLTDGQSTSNVGTCYFAIIKNEEQLAAEAAIADRLKGKKEEADAAYDRAGLNPSQQNRTPGTEASSGSGTEEQQQQADEQAETLRRNWEFEESVGASKTVVIGYEWTSDDGTLTEQRNAEYEHIPYSCTKSTYDELNRKTYSYDYQESITAECAGSIVKAQLESGSSDSGSTTVTWLTENTFYYFTDKKVTTGYEDQPSEYGKAYEEWKEREKLAWEEAMEQNRLASEGESGLFPTTQKTCDLGFTPPDSPTLGDEYAFDGMKFVYDQEKGWVHTKADYVPIASSFPSNIYTSDLTDTTRTTKETLISYMEAQTSYRYGPIREVVGGLSLPFDRDYWVMPSNINILTDKVVTYYDVDWAGGKSKTTTHTYTLNCNTIQGQQLIAKLSENLSYAADEDRAGLLADIVDIATEMVYQGASVNIRTDREYGVQERPSIAEREWQEVIGDEKPDPEVFGDFQVVDRNAQPRDTAASVEQQTVEAPESPVVLEITPPYITGPKREINEDGSANYVKSKAQEQALKYGRAYNAIARGNRYGVSLQVPIDVVPPAPLSWVYLDMRGKTGAYRSNGTSYVFNEAGLLCNMDALFWAGVGLTP